jgi:hypothetical protein
MVVGVGIGAHLEQGADERQRAVVNRVLETGPDGERHRPIGHAPRIVNRRPQRGEVASPKGSVDFLELLMFCASLGG